MIAASAFALPCIAAPSEPTPVELWKVGDDGLTNRLSQVIDEAFHASPLFVVSFKKLPGSLYVGIATNVRWKNIDHRTWVTAQIEVADMPPFAKPVLSGEVSCWQDEITSCAKQVIELAARARKIGQK